MNESRFPHLPNRPTRIAIYFVAIVVLLGVNYWGAHRVTQVTRIRVPYSPFSSSRRACREKGLYGTRTRVTCVTRCAPQ